jgi:hypothetical protein
MEHSLHLAAKHFVQTITPRSSKKHGAPGGEYESDPASDGDDDDNNDNGAVDAGNSLGKAIALVKQVCEFISL